jgi:hypothetical protein
MYALRPESKDAVSETDDKKGQMPTRSLLVEIDAALNAGHWVDLAREMQFCAIAEGMLLASSA